MIASVEDITALAAPIIAKFEGCRLEAYQDVAGIWTIGYGQTGPDIAEGLVWSSLEATQMLQVSVGELVHDLLPLIEVELPISAIPPLVSLVYNIGIEAFEHSHVLKYINANELTLAANAILSWDHAGGKVRPILEKRRKEERELFLAGL